MNSLEDRVVALERSAKRWRWACVACSALLLLSASQDVGTAVEDSPKHLIRSDGVLMCTGVQVLHGRGDVRVELTARGGFSCIQRQENANGE